MQSAEKTSMLADTDELYLQQVPDRGTRYRCLRCGHVSEFFRLVDLVLLFQKAEEHLQSCVQNST